MRAAELEPEVRVKAFLAGLERLGAEDFGRLSLPLSDPAERSRVLRIVDDAAPQAGRSALLVDTQATARRLVERAYARRMYEPTWIGLNWGRSSGSSRDRAAVVAAVEDAAAATVVSDLVGADVVGWLCEPFESVAALSGTADPSESLTRPGWVGYLAMAFFLIAVFFALAGGAILMPADGPLGLAVVAVVFAVVVVILARQRRARRRPSPPR